MKSLYKKGELSLAYSKVVEADFSGFCAPGADFSGTAFLNNVDFGGAILDRAVFRNAYGYSVDFTDASLRGADFQDANFGNADFTNADLSFANLTGLGANRLYTEFRFNNTNLSGAVGLPDQREFLSKLDKTDEGYVVYKVLDYTYGAHYAPAPHWKIEAGEYLTENCNSDRAKECGCGVNFGTVEYCTENYKHHLKNRKGSHLWRCLIEWEDVAGIVVPYFSHGKARCERLRLLEIVGG